MTFPPSTALIFDMYLIDGRFEGGTHSPEYYKYADDELTCGTWEDVLKVIEEFDWTAGMDKAQDEYEVAQHGDLVMNTQGGQERPDERVKEAVDDAMQIFREESVVVKEPVYARTPLDQHPDIQRELEAQITVGAATKTTPKVHVDNTNLRHVTFAEAASTTQPEMVWTGMTPRLVDVLTDRMESIKPASPVLEGSESAQTSEMMQQPVDTTIPDAPFKTITNNENTEEHGSEDVSPQHQGDTFGAVTETPLQNSFSALAPEFLELGSLPAEDGEIQAPHSENDPPQLEMLYELPGLTPEDLLYLDSEPADNTFSDSRLAADVEAFLQTTSPREPPLYVVSAGGAPFENDQNLEQEEKYRADISTGYTAPTPSSAIYLGSDNQHVQNTNSPDEMVEGKHLALYSEPNPTVPTDDTSLQAEFNPSPSNIPTPISCIHTPFSSTPAIEPLIEPSSMSNLKTTMQELKNMSTDETPAEIGGQEAGQELPCSEDELEAGAPMKKKPRTDWESQFKAAEMGYKPVQEERSEEKVPVQGQVRMSEQDVKDLQEKMDKLGQMTETIMNSNPSPDSPLSILSSLPASPMSPSLSLAVKSIPIKSEFAKDSSLLDRHSLMFQYGIKGATEVKDENEETSFEANSATGASKPPPPATTQRKRKSAKSSAYSKGSDSDEYKDDDGNDTEDEEKEIVKKITLKLQTKAKKTTASTTPPKRKPLQPKRTAMTSTLKSSPLQIQAISSSPASTPHSGKANKYGFKPARAKNTSNTAGTSRRQSRAKKTKDDDDDNASTSKPTTQAHNPKPTTTSGTKRKRPSKAANHTNTVKSCDGSNDETETKYELQTEDKNANLTHSNTNPHSDGKKTNTSPQTLVSLPLSATSHTPLPPPPPPQPLPTQKPRPPKGSVGVKALKMLGLTPCTINGDSNKDKDKDKEKDKDKDKDKKGDPQDRNVGIKGKKPRLGKNAMGATELRMLGLEGGGGEGVSEGEKGRRTRSCFGGGK